jgi:hypothetical protein
VLEEQHIGVHLLEGVLTLEEALGLEQTVTIGGIECHLRLPALGPDRQGWASRSQAGPPAPGGTNRIPAGPSQ